LYSSKEFRVCGFELSEDYMGTRSDSLIDQKDGLATVTNLEGTTSRNILRSDSIVPHDARMDQAKIWIRFTVKLGGGVRPSASRRSPVETNETEV